MYGSVQLNAQDAAYAVLPEPIGQLNTMNGELNVASEAQPADLVVTRALLHRPQRAPDLLAERAAFDKLLKIIGNDVRAALQHSTEIAVSLCGAGAAGLSLLQLKAPGEPVFHWQAVSGALAAHAGTQTPRDFSPCGLCLDAGATILLHRPERVFAYLREFPPAIVESLIVPLYDHARRPLGTLWVAHLDEKSSFSRNDVRIVKQLATHATLALKLLDTASERDSALALLQSRWVARRAMLRSTAQRRRRKRTEALQNGSRQIEVFKDALVREAHHRVKNTLQIVASLLSMQARQTQSAEIRHGLQAAKTRLHLLANVHELLYRTAGSTQQIPVSQLFEAIGDALRQSFAEKSARVHLRVTSDEVRLSAETAIPLLLLTNEAVTNAYKHAFPDDASGEITVELRCLPENAAGLRITDNGIGMRSSNGGGGLGLRLIRTFAEQLHGELTFTKRHDAPGTQLTLTMPAS